MKSSNEFPDHARVWVYQSDRVFSPEELVSLQHELNEFVTSWTAHNAQLDAIAEIRYNRFLILAVNEDQANASGCSIDKSVALMKAIEKKYGVNLFDRMQVAYRTAQGIELCSYANFELAAKAGHVSPATIVFNNMVTTVAELKSSWEIPLEKSWQARVLAQ